LLRRGSLWLSEHHGVTAPGGLAGEPQTCATFQGSFRANTESLRDPERVLIHQTRETGVRVSPLLACGAREIISVEPEWNVVRHLGSRPFGE
jgi:hypothetical protein